MCHLSPSNSFQVPEVKARENKKKPSHLLQIFSREYRRILQEARHKRLTNPACHIAAELSNYLTDYTGDEGGGDLFRLAQAAERQLCDLANWAVSQPWQDRT